MVIFPTESTEFVVDRQNEYSTADAPNGFMYPLILASHVETPLVTETFCAASVETDGAPTTNDLTPPK